MKRLILFTALFYIGIKGTNAQPGELDPSFGNNGIASTSIGSNGRQVPPLPGRCPPWILVWVVKETIH